MGGISLRKCKPFKFSDLAAQVSSAIKAGNSSVKKMGINPTLAQVIYRKMRAEGYEGNNMSLYICKKICDEVLKNISRDTIRFLEKFNASLLDDEDSFKNLVDTYVIEKNKDVLFCAMIGATIQSTDSVGIKCLKMVHYMYQSS